MNLVEYLARATEYLDRQGVDSPRLNAEVMLSAMLGISRLEIYTNFDRPLSEEHAAAYKDMLLERAGGCPLQHITGETGFRGLVLEVRPGVFIPRPETEVLVEKALEVLPVDSTARVLDLGSGCGNIAVSVAAELPGSTVIAVDIDDAAVRLARSNADRCGVSDRVEVLSGDLFGPLDAGVVFDLVVSNPPYVPEGARESLPAEVRDFDPEGALFAGGEGLDVIRRIVAGAPGCLPDGGWLALEVDESHAGQVRSMLEADGWTEVEVFEDMAARPRVVRARWLVR
ncbi:MAG TPA: peptide chain release factor N(5)-glutamine methyltransferase [Candidatus Anoxymicrobiaceae bacterium]